jgi:hypothetical protein
LAFGGQSRPEHVQRLHEMFQQHKAAYALVDVAFDPSVASKLDRYGAINLFAEFGMGELTDLGPRLLRWSCETEGQSVARNLELQDLLALVADRPMLSFLQSKLDVGDLARCLQRWCLAHTDEGRMSWPFRFADTRVLPCAFELLVPNQMAMLAGVDAWIWSDRRGEWQVQLFDVSATAAQDQLLLGDDQFAAFMQAAEPDEILNRLHEMVPEALHLHPPHVNHQRVSEALAILHKHHHDGSAVKLKVALAALTSDQGLAKETSLMSAIQTISDSLKLETKLDELLQSEETDPSHA